MMGVVSVRGVAARCTALLLVGASVGCGSSSSSGGVAPRVWVKSVCDAVVPFKNDIQRRAGTINFAGATNLPELKQKLQGLMSAGASDAARAASKVRAAGAPNVTDGVHDEAALVNAFSQLAKALSSAASQARALPTNSATAFLAAAGKLTSTAQTSVSSISPSINSVKDNSTLDAAAKSTLSCAGMLSAI